MNNKIWLMSSAALLTVLAQAPTHAQAKSADQADDGGNGEEIIVSGIREFRAPEDLEGRQIIVICNLKPASLRGVVSNGMLLAAETSDGKSLALLTVDQEIAPGSRVH